MCHACGQDCCDQDLAEGCGCDHCDEPACWSDHGEDALDDLDYDPERDDSRPPLAA